MKPHILLTKKQDKIQPWGVILPEKPNRWDYESGGDPPIMPAYVEPQYYEDLKSYNQALANKIKIRTEDQLLVENALLKNNDFPVVAWIVDAMESNCFNRPFLIEGYEFAYLESFPPWIQLVAIGSKIEEKEVITDLLYYDRKTEESTSGPIDDLLESIHDKIMTQWANDFGNVNAEQKMNAYTVSGFIQTALKQ